MLYTRREITKLALAVPAAAVAPAWMLGQARPNSNIEGVQVGTITYSFRSLADQSAEATLKYILDAGISAIELMGGPVESFAGAPVAPSGGGGGRGAVGGREGGGRQG